jgi:hypothetical protein
MSCYVAPSVLPLSVFSVVVTQPAIYRRAELLFILFFFCKEEGESLFRSLAFPIVF